ncbi:MAG: 16S rRNA (guanine(527)-N(7))-methyltransferase RsmG [Tannerella sp.]|jgi:16S rRNA (guanine527-N7)-methyltransferase|nr:16S rRNA (guanine(527)-N(7))-methyltransferase RsmG [Tannerella sp.]
MEMIRRHFPELSELQIQQFAALNDLYRDWNAKINVISRKDIDNLYEHHVLHSLGIAKYVRFKPETTVLDIGTGGGFPGIPLAILFPESSFLLIDSIGKKIKVTQAIIDSIGLINAKTNQCRIEEEPATFDFVVCRAVKPLSELVHLIRKNVKKEQINAIPNGLLCLKGGELQKETAPFSRLLITIELSNYFHEPYFKTKKLIYLPL